MGAGEFKAECLAIMDHVSKTGESVLITKRGKPVAKLVPAKKQGDDIFGYMAGKKKNVGENLGPGTPLWDLGGKRNFSTPPPPSWLGGGQRHSPSRPPGA